MLRLFTRLSVLTVALSFISVSPAFADKFSTLPKIEGKPAQTLKARFVQYDGGTNGAMIIDVKNTGKKAQTFTTDGLYFVPDGNPEKAPQRLGAGGPFAEIASNSKSGAGIKSHVEKLVIKPGQTRRLALEVFCIDSHRASPNSKTKFSLAKKRLPKKLRKEISIGNQSILRKNKGNVAKSKSAIQSNMWQTRDKDWIKLEGERANEKAPRQMRNNLNLGNVGINNDDIQIQEQRQAPRQRRNAPRRQQRRQ